MLRGIRGYEGVRCATQVLLESQAPEAVLQDSRVVGQAPVVQEAALGLVRAHEAEEQRRVFKGQAAVPAARFSQHNEGRHAGQSGKLGLESVSARSSQALAGGIALAQTLLPQLWLGSEGGASAEEMQPDDVCQLVVVVKGRWPLAAWAGEEKRGGDYSAMDVGRLLYYAAAADGVLLPSLLTETVLEMLLGKQGKAVKDLARAIGFVFAHYQLLEAGLSRKAKAHELAPSWAAPASARPMWPGVFICLCAYHQTLTEFSMSAIRMACGSPLPTGGCLGQRQRAGVEASKG